jgi:hypothetical protein
MLNEEGNEFAAILPEFEYSLAKLRKILDFQRMKTMKQRAMNQHLAGVKTGKFIKKLYGNILNSAAFSPLS